MCNIYCNHENRNVLVSSSLLKKWHFLDLLCAVHVVTITTGSSYSNRSLLKKWHFLDLLCSVHVVTITIGLNCSNRSLLKKWHFLDLICAIVSSKSGICWTLYVQYILEPWKYKFTCKIFFPQKVAFLDLVCSVHVVTITTGSSYSNRSLLKKWHFPDLICSVHVVTITIGLNYSNRSLLKKWHFLDLICAIVSSKNGIFWTLYVHYIL